MPARWELRAARPADREFLFRVYASTRDEELAATGWPDAVQHAFLRSQFDAQDAHYRQVYPDASYDVILADGGPAGRLYVAAGAHDLRIVDLSLLPSYRGQGIGTEVLRAVIDLGAVDGRSVSIHVEQANPARRLYDRMGFRPVGVHGLYVLMERHPAAPVAPPDTPPS